MKGGSKIDGSHLEPIADRDYMARGEHERMKNSLRKMKNIQNPKNFIYKNYLLLQKIQL